MLKMAASVFGAAFFVNFSGVFQSFFLDTFHTVQKKRVPQKFEALSDIFKPFFRTGGRLWQNCRNPVAERQERQRVLLRQERQAEQVAERELHLK